MPLLARSEFAVHKRNVGRFQGETGRIQLPCDLFNLCNGLIWRKFGGLSAVWLVQNIEKHARNGRNGGQNPKTNHACCLGVREHPHKDTSDEKQKSPAKH